MGCTSMLITRVQCTENHRWDMCCIPWVVGLGYAATLKPYGPLTCGAGASRAAKLLRVLREEVIRATDRGALGGASDSLLAALLPALGRLMQPGAMVTLPYSEVRTAPAPSPRRAPLQLSLFGRCAARFLASGFRARTRLVGPYL